MKIRHKFLIFITLLFTILLVYQPHLGYPWPLHVDEWHHIAESIRLNNYGEYFEMLRSTSALKFGGTEMGFHFFLFLLSWMFDLVWTYQFLPAIWTALSSLILFYVTFKKTNKNFYIAWLTMIFFVSIRSNVNLTGLWFFTPLTFSIPFIFLYTYFFTEGLEKQNKRYLLYSLLIALFLIPVHSISVLFALPAFFIYLIINYKEAIKLYKYLLAFLLIPLAGILFYKYTLDIPWPSLSLKLMDNLQFKYGWGVLELHNALTEVYHWIGYFLAIIGALFIIMSNNNKKYTFYLLWPITTFTLIIIYKLTGISYFSPYQRNLYYFAISLPMLSAIGFYSLINLLRLNLKKIILNKKETNILEKFATVTISFKIKEQYQHVFESIFSTSLIGLIFIIVLLLSFNNYYNLAPQVALYHVIEQKHYEAIKFIADFPPATVMATPFVSTALYPITQKHNPVGAVVFYGHRSDVEDFYLSSDCLTKQNLINKYHIKYIISPIIITCNFELIYSQNENFIYKINNDLK